MKFPFYNANRNYIIHHLTKSLLSGLSFLTYFLVRLLFSLFVICFTLNRTDARTIDLIALIGAITGRIDHLRVCTRPLECAVLLVVDLLRVFGFVRKGLLNLFYFVLYFTVYFESSTFFRAYYAKVVVKLRTMVDDLFNVVKLWMLAISSSDRQPEYFELDVENLYLQLISVLHEPVQVPVFEVLIFAINYILLVFSSDHTQSHEH